jgi:hypothetical protein
VRKTEIIEWLEREFQPLKLATPDQTQSQYVENAVRYWNTHSAHPVLTMHNATSSVSQAIDIPPVTKQVYKVYPSSNPEWVYTHHPYWTLLGVTILDNVTTDLIEMATAYQHYKNYIGNDFRWNFVPSNDPTENSKLYMYNFPSRSAPKAAVLGARRILPNEDITSPHILDWILYYTKALVKQAEGNILRKAKIINADADGQQLYDEGTEEKKALEERLAEEGRWLVFTQRI